MTLHQTGLEIDLCYLLHGFYTIIVSGVTCLDSGVVTSYTTFVICVLISGVIVLILVSGHHIQHLLSAYQNIMANDARRCWRLNKAYIDMTRRKCLHTFETI